MAAKGFSWCESLAARKLLRYTLKGTKTFLYRRKDSTYLDSSFHFKARSMSARTLVAMVKLMVYSYPVPTAMSFIGVCLALDLIFVVLVLGMLPTIYGGISRLTCATGRAVCNATNNYLNRLQRRNRFKVKA